MNKGCLSISCQVFSKDQTHTDTFSHNFTHYHFAGLFTIFYLLLLLKYTPLANAETLFPQATLLCL